MLPKMRQFVSRGVRLIVLCAGCAAYLVAAPQAAWAQGEGGAGIKGAVLRTEPSWVAPYFLLVLSLALGLFVVCRPSRRQKPDEENTGPV